MSARVHRRLQASLQYMALAELAQSVLNAIWRPGVVQRFEPLGTLSARDVILLRLRQLGSFQREGAGELLDEQLAEMVSVGALQRDGASLVLPILSGDREKVPRAPAAPALTPEEARAATEAQRHRESFERSFRNYRRELRARGDSRVDDPRYDADLREEYRAIYRPRPRVSTALGRQDVPSEVPPEVPPSAEEPGALVPSDVPSALPDDDKSSRVSLSSLSREFEERERETPEEDVVARARAKGESAGSTSATSGSPAAEVGPEAPGYGRAEVPPRELPERSRGTSEGGNEPPAPGYGRAEVPPRELPERSRGTSEPASTEGLVGEVVDLIHLENLSDPELGALGLKGLEQAGRALKAGAPAAQVRELGALMREHHLGPEQLATAGHFLGALDVRKRYHWEATVAAKGEVTLHFLLGKRLADGRREGDRLLALVTEGETFRARARGPSAQGNLPLGSSGTGPAARATAPPRAPARPLSLGQQRALEIEARRTKSDGGRPVVISNPFGRPGTVSTTADADPSSSNTG